MGNSSDNEKTKEEKELQRKKIDDLTSQIEMLKSLFEQKLVSIEKEKEEKENLKKDAIINLNKILQTEQDNQIQIIKKKIESLSKDYQTWLNDELIDIHLRKIIIKCYQQLFQNEKIYEIIEGNIRNITKELIKEKEIDHLNIEIIGKTGVGKSTLINAIFGEKLALTRKGEPCTMETTCYKSEKYKFIRIYDTRGIQISKDFDIDKVFNETLKDIKEKLEKNEPNDLIHCLIYCFTGTRFEKEEGEIIIKLRKTYEKKTLPIIIVLTQDIGEENDEEDEIKDNLYDTIDSILDEKCGEHLSEKPKDISFIKILAKEKKISNSVIIPSKGLDILLKHCLVKGEYSSKYAVLSSIIYSAEKKIKEYYEKLKENIISEREIKIEKLFNNCKEEEIFEKIIETIFIKFSLLNDSKFKKEHSSTNIIHSVNEKIIKLIMEKEDKVFNEYFKPKAKKIAEKLINKQTEIIKSFDFLLGDNIKDINEFDYKIFTFLNEKFKKISKSIAIKNSAMLISEKIIDIFMDCFIESNLKKLKSDDNKTYIENQLTKGFSKELKIKMNGLINDLHLISK